MQDLFAKLLDNRWSSQQISTKVLSLVFKLIDFVSHNSAECAMETCVLGKGTKEINIECLEKKLHFGLEQLTKVKLGIDCLKMSEQ